MADLISSSIVDGGTVEASQITALYDTFTGATTYDNISIVGTASYSTTASHALNGGGSSVDTGSLLTTASVSNDTITFTKGDTTTFDIEVNNVTSASYASTASFVTTAQTASFVTTAQSSSIATTSLTSSVFNPVVIDIAGGSPVTLGLTILTAGSVVLSGGSGTSTYSPILNGLTNGSDCFVFVQPFASLSPSENFEVTIQSSLGNGRVRITDPSGASSAEVSFIVFSLA